MQPLAGSSTIHWAFSFSFSYSETTAERLHDVYSFFHVSKSHGLSKSQERSSVSHAAVEDFGPSHL